MFNNISWPTYFTVVAIGLAAYYLYVVARYFRGSIKERLSPPPKPRMRMDLPEQEDDDQIRPSDRSMNTENYQETALDEYGEIESLIERIKSTIAGAAERNANPEEVKQYLHLLFNDYPSLKNSDFRPSINEMVVSECNKLGKVTLSEGDVDRLWDAV